MSAPSVLTRPAQRNATGNIDANALVQFSGEVLRTFQAQNKMMGLHRTRSIENGRSASFAGIGTVSSGAYLASGPWITDGASGLQNVPFADKIVNVDAMYTASVFLPDYDADIMHYDVRGPLSEELGTHLANMIDRRLIRTAAKGARALAHWMTGRTTGVSGVRRSSGTAGTNTYATDQQANALALRVLKGSGVEIDAADIQAQLFLHARILTERNCPMDGRACLIRPLQFYTLIASPSATVPILNRDYSDSPGDFARAKLPRVADIELVMSNQYLSDNVGETASTTSGGQSFTQSTNNYRVDLAPSRLITFHRDALATVKLKDLELQTEYSVRAQGTFIVARYAMGHDHLRQEWIIESARADTGTAATADLAGTMAADGTNA